jgi:hypothetical protein
MKRAALLCLASLLSACSAVVDVQTEPMNVSIPVTSIGVPAYAEVAIDLPEEAQAQAQNLTVDDVSADLVVVNPSRGLSLQVSARLSLEGTATPDKPVLYSDANLPPYFAKASVLLAPKTYSPNTRVPESITGPALVQAIGRPRIWVIVANTVTRVGLNTDPTIPDIRLENITLHATVTKDFPGLGGALEVGGL